MSEPHPLIVEAMRKAAVGWIGVADQPATAAWLTWQEGAAYVLHGGAEQPVPLERVATCLVTARGEHGGRIVTWPAAVERVLPGSDEWAVVAPLLAQKRLNAGDPAGAPARWATTATISRLTPTGPPVA